MSERQQGDVEAAGYEVLTAHDEAARAIDVELWRTSPAPGRHVMSATVIAALRSPEVPAPLPWVHLHDNAERVPLEAVERFCSEVRRHL